MWQTILNTMQNLYFCITGMADLTSYRNQTFDGSCIKKFSAKTNLAVLMVEVKKQQPVAALKAEPMTGAQKRILAVVMIGTMMAAIDVTIVLLAIPDITTALHTNLASSIWVILAYLLVTAILTTQLGRLGDIYGRNRMFKLGFLVFTVASGLSGASFSIYMLIAFRVLQGIGGAFMQANSGAIIADAFEPRHRGKAFGFTALGWNIGSMLGIVLGGVLTTFAGWPYIFYINVPIGIVALYFAYKYMKPSPRRQENLDIRGMIVLAASLLLITLGGAGTASVGISTATTLFLVAGFGLLPVFVLLERHAKFPTINFAVFRNRILSNSIMAAFFQSMGYMAVVFIPIMYLQGVRGLSPLNAALLLLPGYVLSSFTGPYMGRLSDKVGARSIATIGVLLMLAAVLAYHVVLTAATPYYIIVLMTILGGLGASMFYPANNSAVMANAQEGSYGAASGILRTLSNIGTLGSFIITISIASLAVSRNVAFQIFLGTSDLTGHISTEFVSGIHAVFIMSAVILGIAAALSWLRGRESRQAHSPAQ